MLDPRSTSASSAHVRSRALDPASAIALFGLPVALAAALFAIPSRADRPHVPERWQPMIERAEPAAIPTLRTRSRSAVLPSPAPIARPESVSAPALVSSAPAVRETPSHEPSLTFTRGAASEVLEDLWTWDEGAFREWWERRRAYYEAYWARQRWARIAPAVARVRSMRAALLDSFQSGGLFDPSLTEPMNDCGPFACGASSAYVPPPSPRASANSSSTARRTGSRWTLSNALVSLSIDTARGCTIEYTLPNNATSVIVFDTPRSDDQPVPSCAARELSVSDGASLELTWLSSGWTQRAVISLAHRAPLAESTIARTVLASDGSRTIELTNLSPVAHQWPIGERTLSLEPGAMVRVRTNDSTDEEGAAVDAVNRG